MTLHAMVCTAIGDEEVRALDVAVQHVVRVAVVQPTQQLLHVALDLVLP